MNAYERFRSKVTIRTDDECWEWTAANTRGGYGLFSFFGRLHIAHRIAFLFEVGNIPVDMFACHHCDNPSCCNPAHLFLGTQADNAADMIAKGRSGTPPKLTPADRNKIRALYGTGVHSQEEIGRMFGVSHTTIWKLTSSLGNQGAIGGRSNSSEPTLKHCQC